jgi:Flp pilus assembly protein CpaB
VKRISPATVTFGVMAIVLGLVAAYVVRQALQKPPVVQKAPPPAPQPDVKYAVFAKNIVPKHTRLTAADVFVGPLPAEMKRPAGTFQAPNLIVGRITKETIAPGKLVREEHLLGLDDNLPDLSERLPAGHRAVTIVVQGAETGGKRLGEGDHVDIAMTVEGSHPDLGEVLTRTIMRNVLVVDSIISRPRQRGVRRTSQLDGDSITVAATPADANKLIVAQRTGILQVTLVSAQDTAPPAADDAVSRRQLLGLKEIVPPKKFMVEKWTGNNVKLFEMSDDRIRESREISSGRREIPVSQPAPAGDQVSSLPSDRNIPTGVKVPDVSYQLGDEPLAAIDASADGAKEVK